MKRILVMVLTFMMISSVAFASEEYSEEIVFRDTPWGISFTEADKLFSEYQMYPMTGEGMKFYPVEQVYSDEYDTRHTPEYHDINIIGMSTGQGSHSNVAGYTTSSITLHFAYAVIDGVITHEEKDSKMYGAQYKFEPADPKAVFDDLAEKLKGLYGDVDDAGRYELPRYYTTEWWTWNGANNTAVTLAIRIYGPELSSDDEVWIAYYTKDGDAWLYEASDGEKERLLRQEREGAASGNTNGL